MNRSRSIAVGILGFLALLIAAFVWSIPRMETDLEGRATQELAAAGIDGISVEFDGRNGTATGARSEEAKEQLAPLRGARWVRAEGAAPPPLPPTTTTAPPPSLAEFTITRNGTLNSRMVRLEGTVETEASRRALVDEVVAAGFDVDDALVVDANIDGTGVAATTHLVGPILDGSDDGELTLVDGVATISGLAFDPVEAEEIDAAIEQATQAGLTVNSMVTTRVLSEDVQIVALQEEINQIFELARAIEGQNPSFEISDDGLSPQAVETLDRVIVAMRRYPLPAADIVGHTDWQGSGETNQALSETRAQSVMDHLTAGGVDSSRLTATGAGESEPIADNNDEAGRAQNRRVDFTVKKSGG